MGAAIVAVAKCITVLHAKQRSDITVDPVLAQAGVKATHVEKFCDNLTKSWRSAVRALLANSAKLCVRTCRLVVAAQGGRVNLVEHQQAARPHP